MAEMTKAQRILKEFEDGLAVAQEAMPKTIQAYLDLENTQLQTMVFLMKNQRAYDAGPGC